ncbi:MAG: arsenite methyltransferase [Pseudomonadota bacterium]
MVSSSAEDVRNTVREHYGKVAETNGAVGCAPGCCGATASASAALGYSPNELASVPEGANLGLGCGNPQAIAGLREGETVLDLGSGGGFDCLLAARQVGPSGRVIGVDMTPQMVRKARENARRAGVTNVDFRLGEIEHLPVQDASVDVILSNCVINLSPSKRDVIREAFRVLLPGGRLAISDVVAMAAIPERLCGTASALTGCVGGAARVDDLEQMLTEAGFADVAVRPRQDSRTFIRDWMPGTGIEEYIASATIEATKPTPTRSCCGPGCCIPEASQ